MSLNRFTSAPTARAVDRVAQELETGIAAWGPPIEVLVSSAGADVAVEHGLGRIPDGCLIVLAVGGNLRAARPEAWTETTAYLTADATHTRGRVLFVQLRREILNA